MTRPQQPSVAVAILPRKIYFVVFSVCGEIATCLLPEAVLYSIHGQQGLAAKETKMNAIRNWCKMHTLTEALQEIANNSNLQRDPVAYISGCNLGTVQLAEIWVQSLKESDYQILILGGTDTEVLLSVAPEYVENLFKEFYV
jgi:hypothetical protein